MNKHTTIAADRERIDALGWCPMSIIATSTVSACARGLLIYSQTCAPSFQLRVGAMQRYRLAPNRFRSARDELIATKLLQAEGQRVAFDLAVDDLCLLFKRNIFDARSVEQVGLLATIAALGVTTTPALQKIFNWSPFQVMTRLERLFGSGDATPKGRCEGGIVVGFCPTSFQLTTQAEAEEALQKAYSDWRSRNGTRTACANKSLTPAERKLIIQATGGRHRSSIWADFLFAPSALAELNVYMQQYNIEIFHIICAIKAISSDLLGSHRVWSWQYVAQVADAKREEFAKKYEVQLEIGDDKFVTLSSRHLARVVASDQVDRAKSIAATMAFPNSTSPAEAEAKFMEMLAIEKGGQNETAGK